MTEPQPIDVLPYAALAEPPRPRWRMAARIVTVFACAVCLVGALLIPAVTVKTVVISGPILCLVASIGIGVGIRIGRSDVWILHTAHASFCLLFVMLVNMLRWSPRKATMPFTLMSAAWAIAATVATIVVLRRLRRPDVS